MNRTIRVGVFNWHQFAPRGGFYPDDIPDEWRLGYFANEFSTACVDLDAVSPVDDEWMQMFDDLPTDFELSFQVKSDSAQELFERLMDQQLVRCKYVLSDGELALSGDILINRVIEDVQLWRPDQTSAVSGVALLPAGESLKQYRLWIESWVSHIDPSEHELTLWGDGREWNYGALNDLKTLVELMGH